MGVRPRDQRVELVRRKQHAARHMRYQPPLTSPMGFAVGLLSTAHSELPRPASVQEAV